MYSRQVNLVSLVYSINHYDVYFTVVHLLKDDQFYCGSDGANYEQSVIDDVEKCLIFMFTRTGRADPDDGGFQ